MAFNKKGNNYFALIEEQVAIACEAAEALNVALKTFPDKLDKQRALLHEIEHRADEKKHEIQKLLAKEFLAPIAPEDIMTLIAEVDDVTDAVEDVLIKLDIFNIKKLNPYVLQFSGLITQCCHELKSICGEFENFRKSNTIHDRIVRLNHLEEDGDTLYTKAISALFREETSAVLLFSWKEIFDLLEDCCDTCEHVSDVIESVIMKNS